MHSSRPLNWLVGPPLAWGTMWSASQSSAANIAVGSVSAASVADLDGSADGPGEGAAGRDGDDGAGAVEQDGFDVCFGEVGEELPGVDDDAVAELAEPVEGAFADEHGEQRSRAAAVLGCGRGTACHLDQCCSTPLCGGSVDAGRAVGEADLFGEPVQFVLDDGAIDRVERAVDHERFVERA